MGKNEQQSFKHAQKLVKDNYRNSECFCKRLGDLVIVTNAAASSENVVPVHKKLFAYRLFHLRMSTCSFKFNCVNHFFNCIFTQIRCLSVRLFFQRLSVLRSNSAYSSPQQWPMTSDFSIPDFIHYIIFYLNS